MSEREGQAVCVSEREKCVWVRERERFDSFRGPEKKQKSNNFYNSNLFGLVPKHAIERRKKVFLVQQILLFFARSGQSVPPPAILLLASFLNGRSELFNISVGLS